ncbi:MAG TPA: hypothetical protein VFB84_16875 [Micromonosporaceae bacterium]|nr:hypothetical protein [Micromonosporaceae bacterium]
MRWRGDAGTQWFTEPGTEGVWIGLDPTDSAARDITVQLAMTQVVAPDERPHEYTAPGGRTVLIPPAKPELTQQTTVRGRPATLERFAPPDSTPPSPPTWKLRWQPVDGLWARIVARDWSEHAFRTVAQTLLLDRAQHCVQPLQATAVPPGTRWTGSHVGISTRLDGGGDHPGLGVWWYSGFTLGKADGTTLSVRLEPILPHDPGSTKDELRPNLTVAGSRPVDRPVPPRTRAAGDRAPPAALHALRPGRQRG